MSVLERVFYSAVDDEDRKPAVIMGDERRAEDRSDDDWEYDDDGRRGERGGGPAFCRTGEGHPVFGRDWCWDKGFGVGDRGYNDRYGNGRSDDVLGRRKDDRRKKSGGWLEDILGRRNN